MQEQRRLGEILLEGAEERNKLRQAATQEVRVESANPNPNPNSNPSPNPDPCP